MQNEFLDKKVNRNRSVDVDSDGNPALFHFRKHSIICFYRPWAICFTINAADAVYYTDTEDSDDDDEWEA